MRRVRRPVLRRRSAFFQSGDAHRERAQRRILLRQDEAQQGRLEFQASVAAASRERLRVHQQPQRPDDLSPATTPAARSAARPRLRARGRVRAAPDRCRATSRSRYSAISAAHQRAHVGPAVAGARRRRAARRPHRRARMASRRTGVNLRPLVPNATSTVARDRRRPPPNARACSSIVSASRKPAVGAVRDRAQRFVVHRDLFRGRDRRACARSSRESGCGEMRSAGSATESWGQASGSVVARMKTSCGGGSSSVLRNALAPSLREHVRLVDDVDFGSHRGWRELHRFAQRANLVDAAIARRVDLHHVHRRAVEDRQAILAGVVGLPVGPFTHSMQRARIFAAEVFPRPAGPENK